MIPLDCLFAASCPVTIVSSFTFCILLEPLRLFRVAMDFSSFPVSLTIRSVAKVHNIILVRRSKRFLLLLVVAMIFFRPAGGRNLCPAALFLSLAFRHDGVHYYYFRQRHDFIVVDVH
jgi:hypothetical protein